MTYVVYLKTRRYGPIPDDVSSFFRAAMKTRWSIPLSLCCVNGQPIPHPLETNNDDMSHHSGPKGPAKKATGRAAASPPCTSSGQPFCCTVRACASTVQCTALKAIYLHGLVRTCARSACTPLPLNADVCAPCVYNGISVALPPPHPHSPFTPDGTCHSIVGTKPHAHVTHPPTGTFDFSLMSIAACVFAFDLDEDLWGGVSLGIGADCCFPFPYVDRQGSFPEVDRHRYGLLSPPPNVVWLAFSLNYPRPFPQHHHHQACYSPSWGWAWPCSCGGGSKGGCCGGGSAWGTRGGSRSRSATHPRRRNGSRGSIRSDRSCDVVFVALGEGSAEWLADSAHTCAHAHARTRAGPADRRRPFLLPALLPTHGGRRCGGRGGVIGDWCGRIEQSIQIVCTGSHEQWGPSACALDAFRV